MGLAPHNDPNVPHPGMTFREGQWRTPAGEEAIRRARRRYDSSKKGQARHARYASTTKGVMNQRRSGTRRQMSRLEEM